MIEKFKLILLGACLYSCANSFASVSEGLSSFVVSEGYQKQMLNQQRESHFDDFIQEKLEPFWDRSAKPGQFINKQGLKIHFVEVSLPDATDTLVISPGRVEGYLKYKEMAFDFAQLGYQVFIIDHQGQGLSSRLLVNTHKGHVNHYSDYTRDFDQFINEIVIPKAKGKKHLLCHSMGSAIGLRYLQEYSHPFDKVVFSSPMWGLPTGPVPAVVLKPVVKSAAWLVKQVEPQSPYFLGNSDYKKVPFLINTLTHSKARYEYFRHTYEQTPELQLGGITYGWVVASINALDSAFDDLDKVDVPIAVLQAEKDIVIDNSAQNKFCERLSELGKPCHSQGPIVIKGAKHEIFIEKDEIRNQGLAVILDFFG